MEPLIQRYETKLIEQHLVNPGEAVLGEQETQIIWNRRHESIPVLENIFKALNINSLLFSRAAEPYGSIIDFLSEQNTDTIMLKDNETRTFLHDIPVIRTFSLENIIKRLKERKCVIIKDHGIITCGTVSSEQTFVNFSSVLFSCFVKYFADHLNDALKGGLSRRRIDLFQQITSFLKPFPSPNASLEKGPFKSEKAVHDALIQTGKLVIHYGLVDSVMGNISYLYNDTLYISQTGSFLDELEGCIDPCPLDNSSCAGITASSELPTHLRIVRSSGNRAILHGHPKFAVIMSMICQKENDCKFNGKCHLKCPEQRYFGNIPIVTGESGTGPNAIVNTVPKAVSKYQAAIVYGHGVFTAAKEDFKKPFAMLCDIEQTCREAYFTQLKNLGDIS